MPNTQQFSITLPNEMAEVVKSKVATGVRRVENRSHARRLHRRDGTRNDRCFPAVDSIG
jgi:Arc/MetJ-type ribon-helix-helix transcriptional regulator